MIRPAILISLILATSALAAEDPQKPFAVVYPVIVRTPGTTVFDTGLRDEIAASLARKLGVTVITSPREVAFPDPERYGSQWDLFQAGLRLIGAALGEDAPLAEYRVVVEYLITPTPRGGEMVGGLEFYVFDADGGTALAGLANHVPGLSVRSASKHRELLARTTAWVIRDGTATFQRVLRERR